MKKGRIAVAISGMVVAVTYAGWRAYRARVPRSASDGAWEPAPFPFPPIPRPAAPKPEPSPEPEANAPQP